MAGIHEVARGAGIKRDAVADVFEEILNRIANGEDVRIKGFGTFERRRYQGRTLKSPAVADGQPIKYPDSYVLKFRQSQLAKRRINIAAKRLEKPAAEKPAAAKKKAKKKRNGG